MTAEKAMVAAGALGRRAGQSFLDTGVWPRCPFGRDLPDLRQAWIDGCFAVTSPAVGQPVSTPDLEAGAPGV